MKKLKKKTMRTTLTLLLLCFAGILFAQNTNFYDKEQIGSQYINTICQDKDNFLWIGTKNGLKRFDGASFISYYHDDKDSLSLSNNEIHSLVVDDKQNLWVGTASGLQRYCPESDNFRTVVFQNMYMSRRVAHIIQCAEGELLCNVQGMGIFRFDADSMIAVPEEKRRIRLTFLLCLRTAGKDSGWERAAERLSASILPPKKKSHTAFPSLKSKTSLKVLTE